MEIYVKVFDSDRKAVAGLMDNILENHFPINIINSLLCIRSNVYIRIVASIYTNQYDYTGWSK